MTNLCIPLQLELYLVQAVKDEILSARLCHRTQTVHFGISLFQHKVNKGALFWYRHWC